MESEDTAEIVQIADLTPAPWYPTERALASTEALRKSIEVADLKYPLLVTNKLMVVDGHRRLRVARALGWIQIPVVYVEDKDLRGVFIDVNVIDANSVDDKALDVLPLTPAQIVRLSLEAGNS